MEHIIIYSSQTVVGLTRDLIETALTAVEGIRGEVVAATTEDRLRAAFREMGYENDSERKVRKVHVLGKLHDDIKRVLSDQCHVPEHNVWPRPVGRRSI